MKYFKISGGKTYGCVCIYKKKTVLKSEPSSENKIFNPFSMLEVLRVDEVVIPKEFHEEILPLW